MIASAKITDVQGSKTVKSTYFFNIFFFRPLTDSHHYRREKSNSIISSFEFKKQDRNVFFFLFYSFYQVDKYDQK